MVRKMLDRFELRCYGTARCSCGCGKVLGNPSVYYTDDDVAVIVADKDDDEGFEWRMFNKKCWNQLDLDDKSLEFIYENYPVAEMVD